MQSLIISLNPSFKIILYWFLSTLVIPLIFLQLGLYVENSNQGLMAMLVMTLLSLCLLFIIFGIDRNNWKKINPHPLTFDGIRNNTIILVVLVALIYLLNKITVINWSSDISLGNVNGFLLLLTTSIVGPMEEELFYRGIIQNHLSRKLRVTYAVVLTTIIFTLSHFGFSIQILLTGILFGYIYHRNGNLWYNIVIHGVLNASPLIFTHVIK